MLSTAHTKLEELQKNVSIVSAELKKTREERCHDKQVADESIKGLSQELHQTEKCKEETDKDLEVTRNRLGIY